MKRKLTRRHFMATSAAAGAAVLAAGRLEAAPFKTTLKKALIGKPTEKTLASWKEAGLYFLAGFAFGALRAKMTTWAVDKNLSKWKQLIGRPLSFLAGKTSTPIEWANKLKSTAIRMANIPGELSRIAIASAKQFLIVGASFYGFTIMLESGVKLAENAWNVLFGDGSAADLFNGVGEWQDASGFRHDISDILESSKGFQVFGQRGIFPHNPFNMISQSRMAVDLFIDLSPPFTAPHNGRVKKAHTSSMQTLLINNERKSCDG